MDSTFAPADSALTKAAGQRQKPCQASSGLARIGMFIHIAATLAFH